MRIVTFADKEKRVSVWRDRECTRPVSAKNPVTWKKTATGFTSTVYARNETGGPLIVLATSLDPAVTITKTPGILQPTGIGSIESFAAEERSGRHPINFFICAYNGQQGVKV